MIDLNDLAEFNEVEEIDPEATSYDAIPPPLPGVHTVKLSVVEGQWKGQDKAVNPNDGTVGWFEYPPGKKQLMIFVEVRIDEPGQPGDGQSIRELINTMVDQNLHTSDADTYLRLLTGSSGVGLTVGQKMAKLVNVLATGPVAQAETDWEARESEMTSVTKKSGKVKDEYLIAKKDGKPLSTYNNFPEVNGVRKPVTETDDGKECRTKFRVKKLLPVR